MSAVAPLRRWRPSGARRLRVRLSPPVLSQHPEPPGAEEARRLQALQVVPGERLP